MPPPTSGTTNDVVTEELCTNDVRPSPVTKDVGALLNSTLSTTFWTFPSMLLFADLVINVNVMNRIIKPMIINMISE